MRIDIQEDLLQDLDTNRPSVPKTRKFFRTEGWNAPAPSESHTQDVSVLSDDLQDLFQDVYDAGFITDMDGRIVDTNVRASLFFSWSREDFLSMTMMDVILGFNEGLIRTIQENLKNDKFTLLSAKCARKDGTLFHAEISSSHLQLSGMDCLCFFVRDITARKQAEDDLLQAHKDLGKEMAERTRINDELLKEIAERRHAEEELSRAVDRLKEHDRAKSMFVSNVSHELKTPVASINHVAGNLLRGVLGPLPGEVKAQLELIKQDCQRLGRTVEDILDMSRIESNTLTLSLVTVPVDELVRRAVESMRIHATDEELTLTGTIAKRGLFVKGDTQKLERILFNIVKNAVKYNVRGGTIDVWAGEGPNDPHRVVITVVDSGIGIEPQHLHRVTERFFRVGGHVSGTGLGLSICKDLVERHGGTLDIKSPPEGRSRGTQVTVTLPRVKPPTIMIVGDDPEERQDLTRRLTACGYKASLCGSGEPIVERILRNGAEAVLLDWSQGGMGGGLVLAQIRNEKALAQIPIVAVTVGLLNTAERDILDGFSIPRMPPRGSERDLADTLYAAIVAKKRVGRIEH